MTGCGHKLTWEVELRVDLRAEFSVQTRFESFARLFLGAQLGFARSTSFERDLRTQAKFDRNFWVAFRREGDQKLTYPHVEKFCNPLMQLLYL